MPGAPGPTMVRVGSSFCIDSTEVTQAQYDVFLMKTAGDTSGQPAECAWNTSYLTDSSCLFDPVKYSSNPVAGVDWCDAYAYCKWAGKHLCGHVGGGPVTPSGMNDATQSEWFAACSNENDGLHAYPYGITYDPTACNGTDAMIDASAPVASLPKCNGGVHGVYDLSGNISEWEDDCVPTTTDGGPSQDVCGARGGDWGAPRSGMACTSALSGPRDASPCWWGIRCCGGP